MGKKILTLVVIVFVCFIPINAFTFFGINWSQLWDSIGFGNGNVVSTTTTSVSQNKNEELGIKGTSSHLDQNRKEGVSLEKKYLVANVTYTKSDMFHFVNSNDKIKSYIKEFGYKCVYVKVDNNVKLTFKFDLSSGNITQIIDKKDCSTEVTVEEKLIVDLKKNGFKAKRIVSYLKKVDLPWMMYVKAIKVFASN